MRVEKPIASLCSVQYDTAEDEVYVTFKVTDQNYKKLAMQFAVRDDIEVVIRGDQLSIKEEQ